MEFWDMRQKDWVDEWKETNQLPAVLRITLKIADHPNAPRNSLHEMTRLISIPSVGVLPVWQNVQGMQGMAPGQGIPPGGQPGALPVPGGHMPGQVPGGPGGRPGFGPGIRR
jgi:hypothetical protein